MENNKEILPLANVDETVKMLLPEVKEIAKVPAAAVTVLKNHPLIYVYGMGNKISKPTAAAFQDPVVYKKLLSITEPSVHGADNGMGMLLSFCGFSSAAFIPINEKDIFGQLVLNANEIENSWLRLGVYIGQGLANARKYEEICAQVSRDELTGLLNRRGFHECVQQEIARVSRFGGYFSIVFYDLDGFKKVNDTHGHKKGDILLSLTGETLRKNTRNSDLLSRYGGDEFALCLVNTDLETGKSVSKRLGILVAETCNAYLKEEIISVSAGVVMYPGRGRNMEELIVNADKAMYESKKAKGTEKCVVTLCE